VGILGIFSTGRLWAERKQITYVPKTSQKGHGMCFGKVECGGLFEGGGVRDVMYECHNFSREKVFFLFMNCLMGIRLHDGLAESVKVNLFGTV